MSVVLNTYFMSFSWYITRFWGVLSILKHTFLQSVVFPYSHVVGPVSFDFFSVFPFFISDVLVLLILCCQSFEKGGFSQDVI